MSLRICFELYCIGARAANVILSGVAGTRLLKFAIVSAWLFAYWPTLVWLTEKAEQLAESMLLQLLLVVSLVFVLIKIKIDADLYASRQALALLLVAACGSVLNASTVSLPQAQASFFLLGVYAWLGLNPSAVYWRKGLNYALLFAVVLPFYLEFSSGLGFGLRLLTAAWVGNSLAAFGIAALSAHDIIIAENAIAHVDLPCSGLKSLWIGSGFFFAAAALLGVRMGIGVLAKYLLFLLLLLSANALRILLLTLLTVVYHWPEIAALLHRPLGLLGFGISCAIAWLLLCRSPNVAATALPEPVSRRYACAGLVLAMGLAGTQGIITLSREADAQNPAYNLPKLPAELHPGALPLTEAEVRFFARSPQTVAQKWRIVSGQDSGSVLLVQSRDFNGFHAPELCLAANGIIVDRMQSVIVAPDLHLRLLSLNRGTASGVYWLQSGAMTSDDFLHRYWRYLRAERDWSLVFVIMDTPPYAPSIEKLAQLIYAYQPGE